MAEASFDWGKLEVARLANCTVIEVEIEDREKLDEGKYMLTVWDNGTFELKKQTWETIYRSSQR